MLVTGKESIEVQYLPNNYLVSFCGFLLILNFLLCFEEICMIYSAVLRATFCCLICKMLSIKYEADVKLTGSDQ